VRHAAAILAVSAGADVKSVQRMLGHSSAAMTLDVYSGLFDDDLDAVADRMDEAFTRSLAAFRGLQRPSSLFPQPDRGSDLAVYRSRLSESNRRPTHYECVALAN
jgi:hypothetical protein